MPPDEFDIDTIIQDIIAAPEATRLMKHAPARKRGRQPEPVIRFARGTFWWLANAILLYLFLWLLIHG
jgi:hypothetical protein